MKRIPNKKERLQKLIESNRRNIKLEGSKKSREILLEKLLSNAIIDIRMEEDSKVSLLGYATLSRPGREGITKLKRRVRLVNIDKYSALRDLATLNLYSIEE